MNVYNNESLSCKLQKRLFRFYCDCQDTSQLWKSWPKRMTWPFSFLRSRQRVRNTTWCGGKLLQTSSSPFPDTASAHLSSHTYTVSQWQRPVIMFTTMWESWETILVPLDVLQTKVASHSASPTCPKVMTWRRWKLSKCLSPSSASSKTPRKTLRLY